MTTLRTDQLRDHVHAYAAAVRAHLADLPPELVDDLTDGLEADLVDALEDPAGPVATGEVPLVRPGQHAGMIDLRARFGPAQEYAAELRAAAGLAPAAPSGRRPGEGVRGMRERAAARVRRATQPVTSSRHWPAVEDVLSSLTPVWWVLRGWVWFVVLAWIPSGGRAVYVPSDLGGAVVLAALVLLSVQLARGRVAPARGWAVRAARVAHVAAVVLVVPLLLTFWNAVDNRFAYATHVVYESGPVEYVEPDAGVWVDGMQVSNLFVYDAEGNPVDGAQVFDDRGREVRTFDGDEWSEWSLPGLAEPWSFTSVEDAEGRPRWNVYPLRGAPWEQWTEDDTGRRTLAEDELRTPPRPFAKAPSVPGLVPDDVPEAPDRGRDGDPADVRSDDDAADGPAGPPASTAPEPTGEGGTGPSETTAPQP